MPFYIGLSGKIGTGKTTVAKLLMEKLQSQSGYRVDMRSFGSALKDEVATVYGLTDQMMNTQKGKATPIRIQKSWPLHLVPDSWVAKGMVTPREILQWYATDYTRKECPDYWVNRCEEYFMRLDRETRSESSGGLIALVDDVRFPNEADFIEKNGKLFRLTPYNGWKAGVNAEHISETALDTYKWKRDQIFTPDFGALDGVAETIFNQLKRG